jgi:hypothetical protein
MNKHVLKWRKDTEWGNRRSGEEGSMDELDSLGTAAPTSQLDFHGTGYKCQLPYLKRFDCS